MPRPVLSGCASSSTASRNSRLIAPFTPGADSAVLVDAAEVSHGAGVDALD